MPRYADVDKLMKHAVNLDWSLLKWVNEVDICTAINPRVVERKHGKWVDDCSCSICHWIHENDKGFALLTDYNFCPNCGADMRKESDNGRFD